MFDPSEHRLYPVILKLVLWDEEEAKIRKRLSVNEVPEDQAESILATARKAVSYTHLTLPTTPYV